MNTDDCPNWQPLVPNLNLKRMRRFPILVVICWLILFIPSRSCAEGTTAEMIQSWKDSAQKGDSYAPFHVGYSYKKGQGVKQDLMEAAKWFKLGAERGDTLAALELAFMYVKGEGIQQDKKEAIRWFKIIEKSGNLLNGPIAHMWLILLKPYELGLGDQWKPYFESKGKTTAYIDTSSIVRLPENKVRAWSMEETPNHEWFMLWLWEVDCTQRMIILRDCKVGPSNMDLNKLTVQKRNKKYIDYQNICSLFGSPSYEYLDPTSDRDAAKYNMWCKGKNMWAE
jgi:TPR repeat protein